MSSICVCLFDAGLEGCMHLGNQLLVLTAGRTTSIQQLDKHTLLDKQLIQLKSFEAPKS